MPANELHCKLRRATAADAEAISALAFRAKAHWGYDAAFMEACRQELRYTSRQFDLPDWRFYVCENNASIMAFYALEKTGADVELEALFVEPACIGQGIGMSMLQHARKKAAALGGRRLVIQSDPHAAGFYRAAGAQEIGTRESVSIPGRELPLFELQSGVVARRETCRG